MFRLLFTFISLLLCLKAEETSEALTKLREAESFLREGKESEAVQILDALHGARSLPPLAVFQIGWLYGQARKYQAAIAVFDSLPADVPDPLTHQYALALSYFNLERYQKTIQILEEAKQRGLTDAKSGNLLGVAYAKAGEAEKAYSNLRDGISGSPSDLLGYLNLVTVCVDYQNLSLAETVATRGVEAFPDSPKIFFRRGAVRLLAGKRDEAHRDFETARKLAPGDPEIAFFLALSDYQRGRYPDAISEIRSAIQQGTSDADLYYLLAEALLRENPRQPARPLAELDRAITLNSNLVSALVLRAKLHLQAGDAAKAVLDLERARAIEPASRPVLYGLARAYEQVGRHREAQALFATVKEDSRTSVDALATQKMERVLVENHSE